MLQEPGVDSFEFLDNRGLLELGTKAAEPKRYELYVLLVSHHEGGCRFPRRADSRLDAGLPKSCLMTFNTSSG
jgi:hypothetical protein